MPIIQTAGQLTHHNQVGAAQRFAFDRRAIEQVVVRAYRAQIGKELQPLAELEQCLLWLELRFLTVVARQAANSTKENRVALLANLKRLFRNSVSLGLDCRDSHQPFVEGEGMPIAFGDNLQDFEGLLADFR